MWGKCPAYCNTLPPPPRVYIPTCSFCFRAKKGVGLGRENTTSGNFFNFGFGSASVRLRFGFGSTIGSASVRLRFGFGKKIAVVVAEVYVSFSKIKLLTQKRIEVSQIVSIVILVS